MPARPAFLTSRPTRCATRSHWICSVAVWSSARCRSCLVTLTSPQRTSTGRCAGRSSSLPSHKREGAARALGQAKGAGGTKVGAAGHLDSDYAALIAAAEAIRRRGGPEPRVAVVLGTGLGGLAAAIAAPTITPYARVRGCRQCTVVGRGGRRVLGELAGVPVVAMRGRFRLYDGYTPQQVVLPSRVLRCLGVEILFV